jgi:hypothetical protein
LSSDTLTSKNLNVLKFVKDEERMLSRARDFGWGLVVVGLVQGCGGGGSNTVPQSSLPALVNWSDVSSNGTVEVQATTINSAVYVSGSSITGSLTSDVNNSATYQVDMDAAEMYSHLIVDGSDSWGLSLDVRNASRGGVFPGSNNSKAEYQVIDSNNGLLYLSAALPRPKGWEYQSFGTWVAESGRDTYSKSFSAGVRTADNMIPSAGTASYTGQVFWSKVGRAERTHLNAVVADFSSTVDFSNNSLSVASQNTAHVDKSGNVVQPFSYLDVTGSAVFSGLGNGFSGTIQNSGGDVGSIDGWFYGPLAQEMGGVMALRARSIGTRDATASFGAGQ